MGSYDGAESCELVGSFLLHQIAKKHEKNFGLYRDDGLGVVKATPREIEMIKKDLCSIFNHRGLKITIEANKKAVDFLDVTLNLSTAKYQPYNKPNNVPLYVHNKSNHPPKILQNIPLAINKHYCEIRTTLDTTFDTRFNTTFDTTFKNRARSFQSFKSIQTDIVII